MIVNVVKECTFVKCVKKVSTKGNKYAILDVIDGDNTLNVYVKEDNIGFLEGKHISQKMKLDLNITIGKFSNIQLNKVVQ